MLARLDLSSASAYPFRWFKNKLFRAGFSIFEADVTESCRHHSLLKGKEGAVKRTRFSVEQFVVVLKQAESGTRVPDLIRYLERAFTEMGRGGLSVRRRQSQDGGADGACLRMLLIILHAMLNHHTHWHTDVTHYA